MKTIGLIPSQELVSLDQDGEGNWLNVPEGQTVVPLVKTPPPTLTGTQRADPILVWFNDRVERQWDVHTAPAPVVPPSVSMRDFRLACGRALWLSIEAAVAAMEPEDARWEAQQYLDKSTTVDRRHPFVLQLAAALGKTDQEVDAIFITADAIEQPQ